MANAYRKLLFTLRVKLWQRARAAALSCHRRLKKSSPITFLYKLANATISPSTCAPHHVLFLYYSGVAAEKKKDADR
jgi:hypothetical protein